MPKSRVSLQATVIPLQFYNLQVRDPAAGIAPTEEVPKTAFANTKVCK